MGQAEQIIEGKDMRIVGGDHEVAFFARECPHRSYVRVDQSLEELRKNGLGRALLAGYCPVQDRGRPPAVSPTGRPPPVQGRCGCEIEKRCELLDGAACLRYWQR